MLDLAWVRQNCEALDHNLSRRGQPPCGQKLLELDRQCREAKTLLQELRTSKNQIASQVALCKQQNLPWQNLLVEAETLKTKEEALCAQVELLSHTLYEHLTWLPNLLDESVPTGTSELDNLEIHRWGTPRHMPWVQDHVALGKSFEGMDFSQASKVSGSRFVYLKGDLARLERALAAWMLDFHTREHGFLELATPYLVTEAAMFGAGLLPKFQEDSFCTTSGLFLIPTSEVSLVNWAREKTFSPSELPLCLTALTPCFRSEAGSSGKDTHGMIRQHQFHKVEMVVICTAEDAPHFHEKMTVQAEALLQQLDLPYRRVLLCSQDTGSTAQKTYDLEVWVPSQGKYREIASCSHCGTFQARRLGAKVKGKEGTPQFLHTLNGSGLPTGRTLLALLENHQQEDGSVKLPPVLHPYMGGQTELRNTNGLR